MIILFSKCQQKSMPKQFISYAYMGNSGVDVCISNLGISLPIIIPVYC